MTTPPPATPSTGRTILASMRREIVQPFVDLGHAPRALWGVNLSYLLEGVTYFGALSLLAIFFNDFVGLDDINAGRMVGILTAGITLAMLVLGATVDLVGPRRALLLSLALMLIGRVLLAASPQLGSGQGLWSPTHLISMLGILWIILGYGIYQPACYAAAKFFTTEKTAGMAYAMLYAIMNLGAFLPGLISPPVRRLSGIPGVFWVYVALTVGGMAVVALMLTSRAVREARELAGAEPEIPGEPRKRAPLKEQVLFYLKNFPIRDGRFLFFIFILIPVQTLFAHVWLTMPQYCNRAFTGIVSENYETFTNLSPLLIFILTPVVAALTSKRNTYAMMISGTFVMAAPTFILALGPTVTNLFAFLILMTVGEAMWSPRFLQWIAESAPPGMTGIYMGIGQFPWFLTKVVTSLYSGWFLMTFCPAGVPPEQMRTETMWFIYGLIAMVTPISLVLARRWMLARFNQKPLQPDVKGI